jgi:hypothetical protein
MPILFLRQGLVDSVDSNAFRCSVATTLTGIKITIFINFRKEKARFIAF